MNAQQRVALLEERLNEYKKMVRGDLWPFSQVIVMVTDKGWSAYVDHKRVGEINSDNLVDALILAEQQVDRITDSDALLARTLGIAS